MLDYISCYTTTTMPISAAQKTAIEEVIDVLVAATPPRGKRQLAALFLELVDRADWPEYYEVPASIHPWFICPIDNPQVIPEPRCINGVRASVEKNRYKDPINAYTDLSLVFWNALFYNEPGSQIASDAETLKVSLSFLLRGLPRMTHRPLLFIPIRPCPRPFGQNVLETEWQKRPVLPPPRHSPPPSSPQKVHGSLPTAPPQPDPAQSTHSTAKLGSTAEAAGSMATGTHPPDPDLMDVDVHGMSPEPDTTAGPTAGQDRDGDNEAIIRQLEKSLPPWEGFGDLGWMSEASQVRLVHCLPFFYASNARPLRT